MNRDSNILVACSATLFIGFLAAFALLRTRGVDLRASSAFLPMFATMVLSAAAAKYPRIYPALTLSAGLHLLYGGVMCLGILCIPAYIKSDPPLPFWVIPVVAVPFLIWGVGVPLLILVMIRRRNKPCTPGSNGAET